MSDSIHFCPNCGQKLSENSSFCQQCGYDIYGVRVQRSEPPVAFGKQARQKFDTLVDRVNLMTQTSQL